MSRTFLRVAKVGGSLFDFPDLPTALRCWFESQPGLNLLLAGGGPFVDVVRRVDETFALDDSTAHRLALEAMRVSAELLAALLPDLPVVRSLGEVHKQSGSMIFDPTPMLNLPECRLPHSWDVTSDSIAAHVAGELQADELVLFKSTPLPANTNRSQAIVAGLIDRYFEEAAKSIKSVRWVCLRGTPITERPL
jgi:5-(aminomethyl)-3-furanmethanol phosphate kinase